MNALLSAVEAVKGEHVQGMLLRESRLVVQGRRGRSSSCCVVGLDADATGNQLLREGEGGGEEEGADTDGRRHMHDGFFNTCARVAESERSQGDVSPFVP